VFDGRYFYHTIERLAMFGSISRLAKCLAKP
jgi:hypothetical protein